MTKIFISYRRQDTKPSAFRIYERLAESFGGDGVFIDMDTMRFGVDFPTYLENAVKQATTMLVLIGHGWADARDKDGKRRLENPKDFVRLEIEAALAHDVTLGAVLLDGAPMPREDQLPESLHPLLRRNAAFVDTGPDFNTHMKRLIADINHIQPARDTVAPKPTAGGNLDWSATEWARIKDSTDIARLKRFAGHAHPYYAEEALDRVRFLEDRERERAEAEARAKAEAEAQLQRAEDAARRKAEAERLAHEEEEKDRRAGIVRLLVGTGGGRDELRRIKPGSGESFKDAPFAPEMVVVPAGEFLMGSPATDAEGYDDERPQHKVIIPRPFAVGRYAVTFDEWDAAVAEGACGGYKPSENGWGRGRRPVINVSWEDAQAYIKWLNIETNKVYRLLTEPEWEYVCRAGTKTRYWWGDSFNDEHANTGSQTVPVDEYKPNPWGLYQVHGNVGEWCEDVWHSNYNGAPSDGSAWTAGGEQGLRVLRGGSWYNGPRGLRSAFRFRGTAVDRFVGFGFRLART